jgi:hypothetical protein
MAVNFYDDNGIRFEYPDDWEIEDSQEGPVTTIALQSSEGPAFAIITVDDTMPTIEEVSEAAVEALRDEYPALDATPVSETFAGFPGIGYDIEFISLDMTNACSTRCVRTPRRTILVFGQWSDLEGDEPGDVVRAIRRSLAETDA